MNKELIEFSRKLLDAKEAEEFNSKLPLSKWDDRKTTISFHLCYTDHYIWTPRYMNDLITLDKEDIEYFKQKYLPKLEEEFKANMDALKKEYSEQGVNV